MSEEPLIAVFVDYENLALGVRDMKAGELQIELILKRCLRKAESSSSEPIAIGARTVKRSANSTRMASKWSIFRVRK